MPSDGGRGGRRGAKMPDGVEGWHGREFSAALVSKYKWVKGKKYGPYLYRQWRDYAGKIHSVYVGHA